MLVLTTAAAALTLLPTAPAHAAEGYDRCPDTYYCMFSGLDGSGDMITIKADTPDLAALNMSNRGKSDWNRTGVYVHLYSDANYGGCSAATSPGGKGNFYVSYRDFFESVRVGGPNGPSCYTPPES
ncbi:peptidase inhibitor family I36 protein [Nonomuraea pusilla]|nr:peptidase inhibitor family I36 protein [Nonomuraea pusilla]